jgi:predicted nucleic acid-binding protein
VPSIAADAGPLVALFKGADNYHSRAVEFVAGLRHPLVTNVVVVGEVVALLVPRFQTDFLDWAIGALQIDRHTAADLPRIVEIMKKYADLPAEFADASLLALCERLDITMVATLDHHFDVYRTARRRHVRNVFFST